MTDAGPSAFEIHRALARRGWRIVFVLAAGLYLTGSHWPRLEMDALGDGGPSPDKILHVLAFLLLTLPAWWTGWFRSLGTLWFAGLGFAIFDEVTQWLLPIGRNLTVADLLCDVCGVTAAVAILAAAAPMEDPRSRLVAAQRRIAEATLLAKASNWMVLAATAALGVVVVVPIAVMASGPLRIEPRAMGVAGAAVGAAVAGLAGLEFGVRATRRRLRDAAACLRCGTCGTAGSDEHACAACGGPRRSHDWFVPPRPSFARWVDAAWWPSIRAGLVAIAVVAVLGLLGVEARWFPSEPTVARVVDLTVLVVASAWGVHGVRRRLAEVAAAADRRCVRCDHDLRGLTGTAGDLRCPECGCPCPVGGAFASNDAGSTTAADRETMSG